jgi:hypothetical protein
MTLDPIAALAVSALAGAGVFNYWAKKQVKTMSGTETTFGISRPGKEPKSSTPVLVIWEMK